MAQITSKFIGANEVKDQDIRLDNNDYLRARNAANNADVNILRVNSSDQIEFPSFPRISGTPSNSAEIATKGYVDSAVSGFTVSSISSGATASGATHYFCNANSAAFTLTLPSAGSNSGMRFIAQKTDTTTNEVTLSDGGSFSEKLYIEHDLMECVSDGTAWRVARRYTMLNSQIRLNGLTGYGSSGTTTIRFTNNTSNTGRALTLTQSATNGDSITVNKPGLYAILLQMNFSAANRDFGITKNGTSSTSVAGQTVDTNTIAIARSNPSTTGVNSVVQVTIVLAKNDVIRFQTDAGGLGSASFSQASMVYLGT